MKLKLTIIDYIIIILMVYAVIFAFIHITTDDSSDLQKTAFDESTINKIPDTYFKYYKDGYIIKANVEGFNATNGNKTTLNGTVIWEDEYGGNGVKLLIDSNNKTYLVGLYRTVPNADVYIDKISLESNGEKYRNLYEFRVKPIEISSLKDLTDKLPDDGNYEISTTLSLDSLSSKDLQKISNKLFTDSKRESIKSSDYDNELTLKKATKQNLEDADTVLGNINAASYEITIRLYDATDSQVNEINKNFDIINMRTF